MPYTVIVNTPGYLPTDDDPPQFDTWVEVLKYIRDDVLVASFGADDTWYARPAWESVTATEVKQSAGLPILVATHKDKTPHGLGVVYSVVWE